MTDLKTSFEIAAIDRFSGLAAKVGGVADKLKRQIEGGKREVEALGKTRESIAGLEALEQRVGKSGQALAGRCQD